MKINGVEISGGSDVIDSDTTYYIATTGDDSTGDGSSGSPWKTPNKALGEIARYIITGGVTVTIDVADGTYNNLSTLVIDNPYLPHVIFDGNTATPGNVVWNFSDSEGIKNIAFCFFKIQGAKLVGPGSNTGDSVLCSRNAVVEMHYCNVDDWDNGPWCYQSGFMYINNCTMNNLTNGVRLTTMANSYIHGTTISNCTTGLSVSGLARAATAGNTYSGNTANESTATGGVIQAV